MIILLSFTGLSIRTVHVLLTRLEKESVSLFKNLCLHPHHIHLQNQEVFGTGAVRRWAAHCRTTPWWPYSIAMGVFYGPASLGAHELKEEPKCVTAPICKGSICNWVRSFLPARAGAGGLGGQGLPATMPGHSPCWSQWSCTHPSASGSLWLDDLALFSQVTDWTGKADYLQFWCDLPCLLHIYTSAAVILACNEDT